MLVDTNFHVVAPPLERDRYPLDPLAGAAEELARAGAATSEGAEASEGEAKPEKRPPRKAGAGARRRKEKPAGDA